MHYSLSEAGPCHHSQSAAGVKPTIRKDQLYNLGFFVPVFLLHSASGILLWLFNLKIKIFLQLAKTDSTFAAHIFSVWIGSEVHH